MDWSIYAKDPNGEGVIFPLGHADLHKEPVWGLWVQPADPEHACFTRFDEWGLYLDTENVTYAEAKSRAWALGLKGSPIGEE
jgi:hypothetical protein